MLSETVSTAMGRLKACPTELSPVRRLPPVPWRDPHSVSPEQLAEYIGLLENACAENPGSADLRTCLGMAYAMNFDAYKSMDVLKEAIELEPDNFWAQAKYGELYYRLRALRRAERETQKALDLAGNRFELAVARQQLQEIRKLMREGTQKPEWNGSLKGPAVLLVIMLLVCVAAHWR